MNLRLAVSVVFVGALAYACGPQSRSTTSSDGTTMSPQGLALASIGGSAARTTNAVEKSVKSTSKALVPTFEVQVDGGDVRFQLSVVNNSAKSVEVNFPSGQAYDFVVVDSVGREVWRWADGRIFTQSVQNKLLGKGEAISVSEKWSAAKPGRFTAIAVLRSSNFPIEEKVAFERK